MPVKIISSGGGSVTLSANTTASNFTLNLPAASGNIITSADSNTVTQAMLSSGLAGTGPAFSAYLGGTNQTVSNGTTAKVQINTEDFDTASCFDSTTNYRFTPNVAGYYQFNGNCYFYGAGGGRTLQTFLSIYKNGSMYVRQQALVPAVSGQTGDHSLSVSHVIYMNGSTDYVELYCYFGDLTSSGSGTVAGGSQYTRFNGFLARAA